jgi:hypothetical protein
LLKAFKTDELDQSTIDREIEIVRAQLYEKSKAKFGRTRIVSANEFRELVS